jgi:hypothetical protein
MDNLKEYIKSLVRKHLEEESSLGGEGGTDSMSGGLGMTYATPKAFSPKGQKKNKATKTAEKQGFKKISGMPKNSKILDYKELWKGKKSAMNEQIIKYKESADNMLSKIKPTFEEAKIIYLGKNKNLARVLVPIDYADGSGFMTFICGETTAGDKPYFILEIDSLGREEGYKYFDDINSLVKYVNGNKVNGDEPWDYPLEESDYDKASPSSNPSLYLQASGYTGGGIKGDDYYNKGAVTQTNTTNIEEMEDNIKVGDKLKHKLTGAKMVIVKVKGNDLVTKITDAGNTKTLKVGDINKTNKLLIGKTYEKINESLLHIIEQELLNEVTYSKFKNEVKFRTKSEQLHKAIREVKRKLAEIDRIVEYTSRMKQELSEGEEGLKYWKATQKNVANISEMVNHLNNKIKNLNQ